MVLLVGLLFCARPAAAEFTRPLTITDGSRPYHLSRLANDALAFSSTGTLHVVYGSWSFETKPDTPSFVYWRTWTRSAGWSEEVHIDNSVVLESGPDQGRHIGGKHPTLAIDAEDNLWVTWHDFRHCHGGAPNNYIDNVEIYADFKARRGSFSESDIRLTQSNADHYGDNGYSPRIAVGPDGRAQVCWYDFHEDNMADLYLKTSDAEGVVSSPEAMSAMRLTRYEDRGGQTAPPYVMPDLAIDSRGDRHVIWGTGLQAGTDLHYGRLGAGSDAFTDTILDAGGTDFFDPAHITVAPNDNVWVAYGRESDGANENVVLRRKPAGASGFEAPIAIAESSARQYMPDVEVDSRNRAHVVWVDEGDGRHIYYAVYDPAADQLSEKTRLTSRSGDWVRPTLALDEQDRAYVLFEEDPVQSESSDIWFTFDSPPPAAAEYWELYE